MYIFNIYILYRYCILSKKYTISIQNTHITIKNTVLH